MGEALCQAVGAEGMLRWTAEPRLAAGASSLALQRGARAAGIEGCGGWEALHLKKVERAGLAPCDGLDGWAERL